MLLIIIIIIAGVALLGYEYQGYEECVEDWSKAALLSAYYSGEEKNVESEMTSIIDEMLKMEEDGTEWDVRELTIPDNVVEWTIFKDREKIHKDVDLEKYLKKIDDDLGEETSYQGVNAEGISYCMISDDGETVLVINEMYHFIQYLDHGKVMIISDLKS